METQASETHEARALAISTLRAQEQGAQEHHSSCHNLLKSMDRHQERQTRNESALMVRSGIPTIPKLEVQEWGHHSAVTAGSPSIHLVTDAASAQHRDWFEHRVK